MRRTRHDGFDLLATLATVLFVLTITAAAFVGHRGAGATHGGTKPTHHMASLADIESVLKKTQGEESR